MAAGSGVLLDMFLDIGFVPIPNTVVLLVGEAAPDPGEVGLTAVAGMIFDGAGRLLLTEVAARGHDLPGGHAEPGERPLATLRREVREETGLRLPPGMRLTLAAACVITVAGPRPAGYRYPYPLSQMWIYTARLDGPGPPLAPPVGSECLAAGWVEPAAVRSLTGPRLWHAALDRCRPVPISRGGDDRGKRGD
ncbi:MAG: NUDIX hydrolase [Frankia sp.]